MNVIVWLEYELAYYDSAVHRFNHYTTRGPLKASGLDPHYSMLFTVTFRKLTVRRGSYTPAEVQSAYSIAQVDGAVLNLESPFFLFARWVYRAKSFVNDHHLQLSMNKDNKNKKKYPANFIVSFNLLSSPLQWPTCLRVWLHWSSNYFILFFFCLFFNFFFYFQPFYLQVCASSEQNPDNQTSVHCRRARYQVIDPCLMCSAFSKRAPFSLADSKAGLCQIVERRRWKERKKG